MAKILDGKKIRDEILADLKDSLTTKDIKPILAVLLVGADPVSVAYVSLKQKIAEKVGVGFALYRYEQNASEDEVLAKIRSLNNNPGINGIMIQIPLPAGFNRDRLIRAISPAKDVDGLRYCLGLESGFQPPVVLAIAKAIELSGADLKKSSVVIVGRGFLVGDPLGRYLLFEQEAKTYNDSSRSLDRREASNNIQVIESLNMVNLQLLKKADVIISAAGRAGLIKLEMVKGGVILVDAGTSEVGGEVRGDVDPEAYRRASFYTPVPGGIGPLTAAMLMKNLVIPLNRNL